MVKASELEFSKAECCRRVFQTVPRQLDLARLLGVTPSAISNAKRRGQCSLEMVVAASNLTGRSIEWFVLGKEKAEGPREKRLAKLERSVRRLEERVEQLEVSSTS